jgi:hypothetical protein
MYKEDKDVMIHLCQPPYRSGVNGKEIMIQIGVYRYGRHTPKIGINRLIKADEGMKNVRLGRVTAEEANYILTRLPEAIEELEKSI